MKLRFKKAYKANGQINGNIILDKNTASTIAVRANTIKGNLEVTNSPNSALEITIELNEVNGNVYVMTNLDEFIDLLENSIKGNLKCEDNDAAPTGEGNEVTGNREGQCAELQPREVDLLVFVSSDTFTGNLVGEASARYSATCGSVTTGLEAGDCICQTLAVNAGLSGEFVAWLGDSNGSAHSRMNNEGNPYVNLDGDLVADDLADLTDGTLKARIAITESGTASCISDNFQEGFVWTGTTSGGDNAAARCMDWTADRTATGVFGDSCDTDGSWTESGGPVDCINALRIYCFEQS